MSGKLIHKSLFLLVALCVTLLVTSCAKTIEMKGARAASKVQITVDAGDIKGDISTMLTGVNMSYYYDTDLIWADGSIAGYLSEVKPGYCAIPAA